jgi:hypothetical protein
MMNRIETEIKLTRDRAWALETWTNIDPDLLVAPCTRSGADPDFWWTAKDHFSHLVSVERNFTRMVATFIDGASDAVASVVPDLPRERADMALYVDTGNDRWVKKYHDASLEELAVLGERARTATYELMSRLSDADFERQIPGAAWDGGTVGAMICVPYGNHGLQHWNWVQDGWRNRGLR